MWTTWVARLVVAFVFGAVLIGFGIAEHRAWLFTTGVLGVGFGVAVLTWLTLNRWRRSAPWVRWAAAGLAGLVVALPSVALPWMSYEAQTASQARWSVETDAPVDPYVIGARVYLHADQHLTVVDHRTGDVTADLSLAGGLMSVGSDGTIYDQSSDGLPVIAYDVSGTELWRRPGNAIAASGETTAVRHCPGPIGSTTGCRLVGVDTATGTQRWSRRVANYPSISTWAQQPELPSYKVGNVGWWPALLPMTAIVQAPGESAEVQVLDVDSGAPLHRLSGGDVGLAGELVVHASLTDGACTVRGYRDGREQWASDGLPAADCPRILDIAGTRMYIHGDDRQTVTMDLTDGSWRRCGEIEIPRYDDENAQRSGVGDDDVIVYRDGDNEIFAVDADTGEELWQRETTGDRPAGLTVANGAVTVYHPADTDNPFVPGDFADNGYVEIVLDARTGEETGRWIGHWADLWTSIPVGPGRALLIAEDKLFPVGRDG